MSDDSAEIIHSQAATIDKLTAEIDEHKRTLEALWPFIRVWGLCGACIEAIRAMEGAAKLLRRQSDLTPQDAGKLAGDAEKRARAAAFTEVAEWFADKSRSMQMLQRNREEIARQLRTGVLE